jgi:hypothetical protein
MSTPSLSQNERRIAPDAVFFDIIFLIWRLEQPSRNQGSPKRASQEFCSNPPERATVVPMDECKTSKLCSLCHHSLKKARLLATNDDGEFELRKNRNVLRCANSRCKATFWN